MAAIVGQASRQMGMVVLHLKVVPWQALAIARGLIVGMHVADDQLGLHVKQPLIECDRGAIVLERLQVLHVANVLAQEGILVARQTKGILEFGATGQHGTRLEGQANRKGRIPPGSSHRLRPARRHEPDTVVIARIDATIVQKKTVSNAP